MDWRIITGLLLIWLYPWFVLNILLFNIFYKHRKLLQSWKAKRIMLRETVFELRYLYPFFNWGLMANLIKGQLFIEAYIVDKLEKEIEKNAKR